MAKKFYLVSSYHEEYGHETVGLFDSKEQAEAAATLEELEVKNDKDYDDWMDFHTTVQELEIDTKNYVSALNDYKMKEEEIDENDKNIIKDLLKNRKKLNKKENKEFDGYVLSDEEVKELEKYGRSGVSTAKKNVEDSLKELKEQANG